MRSPGETPRGPGGLLQEWHRGTCQWFENVAQSAQELHQRVLRESAGVLRHLEQHKPARQRRRAPATAFASMCASAPALRTSRVRFRGKGMNCIVSDLADSSLAAQPKSHPVTGGDEQERVLVSEVDVVGIDGELKEAAERALAMKPNFSYTLQEVREHVNDIYGLGWFNTVSPVADDTRDGIKLTIEVEAHPQLKGVSAAGASVLPTRVIEEAFRHQYDKTLNAGEFQSAIAKLDSWYADRGIFGQVTDVRVDDGVVNLTMAEMLVGKLNLKFEDKKTGDVGDAGKTRPEIILRQLNTKPGQVYSLQQARRDIDSVFGMGLFEDVKFLPQQAEGSTLESPIVDLTLQVKERKASGLSAGVGMSAQGHAEGAMPGFIGSCSYSQRNLFGLNQKLIASFEAGQLDSTFRISHTDPWVNGDANRISRTVSLQNNRTSGNMIHAKAQDAGTGQQAQATGPEGNVMVGRLLGAMEYGRPLNNRWTGTTGINFQKAHCTDDHGRSLIKDCYDAPLTFSGTEYDTMLLALLRCVYTGRSDSHLVLSVEQAVPTFRGWLNFNRLRARADRSVPLGLNQRLKAYGCVNGGAIFGEMPPYEAFPIGGTASVRGYGEGAVGSGKRYVSGTAELHFPLIQPVEGTLLFDYGTDLNSGSEVLGDPAGVRGKPGSGYGYGAGLRIDSPVGPLRLEYAWNKHGQSRVHLGIGSHG